MLVRLPVKKIVDANDVGSLPQQFFTQMRPKKSGTAGY